MIDRELDPADVVQVSEGIQRTQRIALELAVAGPVLAGGGDQDADAIFQINDVQQVIRDDHTVAGAKSMLDPFGEVQGLLDADQRVSAHTSGLSDLLHDEGGVPFRSLLHLRVVPGEVFSGIAGVPAQGFLGEIGCELVGVRALLGVR